MRTRTAILLITLLATAINAGANPIKELIERISPGNSDRFIIHKTDSPEIFFELDSDSDKIVIRGNDYVSIATGLNHYLKYHAGIHLSWNNMQAELPDTLPAVTEPERHETDIRYRYYLNYCTHSYSTAFWDWKRWEKEIDWMALHGINLPLAITGTDVVWRNILQRLGYSSDEISEFIAGPAYQAWWLMNNLEGWGGPNPDSWYDSQEKLQKQIVGRMRMLDMSPVLTGYSGMVPDNAGEKLGLNVQDPGKWCSYRRPAFLQPTDPRFSEIASLYYDELTKLYGQADFYSMDPFHEGGSSRGVDLDAAGKAILDAMKKAGPTSKWVIQGWQENPRSELIKNLPSGDMLVLDLSAESRPQWRSRKTGFDGHDWAFCMLLNFGGNIGLHGRMQHVIDEYRHAQSSPLSSSMKGIGLTMEGIENNPVMYELMSELPWQSDITDKDEWLRGYITARYGAYNDSIFKAWQLLGNSIYNCPAGSAQQGTTESIFCARPSADAYNVSAWSAMTPYYNPGDVIEAARLFISASDKINGDNYEYDLVDILRQAVAEKGRVLYNNMREALKENDSERFRNESDRFLNLIMLQDTLLGTRREFMVGTWTGMAVERATTPEEAKLYEWNARTQITTWGNRTAADDGKLHDYAHKEWNGILRDFYHNRWRIWIDRMNSKLTGDSAGTDNIDWYAIEEPWTRETGGYSDRPSGDPITVARMVIEKITQ